MEYIQLPPRESDQKVFVADISKITNKYIEKINLSYIIYMGFGSTLAQKKK